MTRNVVAARADRYGRLLVKMDPGNTFGFTFLYTVSGRVRSVSAELSGQVAVDLLVSINEALQRAVPLDDDAPVVADAKTHAIWVAELIKERDELKDQCKDLLDQVQCLQWDLSALQVQHNLCREPVAGEGA
ncbi:hypothetical protein ACWDUL_32635 [Nocardia niigatensis]